MTLVYVTNNELGEVADLPFDGRVSYRNPRYWRGEVEDCDDVYIHGDWPEIEEAYGVDNYPKQVSENGWYELSNGERVRGEEKAIKAEQEL